MNTSEELARKTLILGLLEGYLTLASSITEGTVDSFLSATSGYSISALRAACERYSTGDVDGHDRRFPPNAGELAAMARMFDDIEKRRAAPAEALVAYPIGAEPPAGYVPLGPLEIDHGYGRINLRGLDHPTKEFVMVNKRLPAPEEAKRIGVVPKLQRMGAR